MHKKPSTRPNLSVEAITAALAILGANTLVAACGGAETKPSSPVDSHEVHPSGGDAGSGPADGGKGGQHSCGAHRPGDASCSAKK